MYLNGKHITALVLVAILLLGLIYVKWVPDRYDITAPLDVTDTPTFVTPFKFKLMTTDACFASLDKAGVDYKRMVDRATGEGCGFYDAALVKQTTVPWTNPISLACPMAAALVMWELHDLQPAAEKQFGRRVAIIENYGSYACRNINNRSRGVRSQHATANALDISGFTLVGGEMVLVRRDWHGDGPEAKFLRKLHRSGCFYFNTALGPDYNNLHHDHFHFDQGAITACR